MYCAVINNRRRRSAGNIENGRCHRSDAAAQHGFQSGIELGWSLFGECFAVSNGARCILGADRPCMCVLGIFALNSCLHEGWILLPNSLSKYNADIIKATSAIRTESVLISNHKTRTFCPQHLSVQSLSYHHHLFGKYKIPRRSHQPLLWVYGIAGSERRQRILIAALLLLLQWSIKLSTKLFLLTAASSESMYSVFTDVW